MIRLLDWLSSSTEKFGDVISMTLVERLPQAISLQRLLYTSFRLKPVHPCSPYEFAVTVLSFRLRWNNKKNTRLDGAGVFERLTWTSSINVRYGHRLGRGLVANDPIECQTVIQYIASFGYWEFPSNTDFLMTTGLELGTYGRGHDVVAGNIRAT